MDYWAECGWASSEPQHDHVGNLLPGELPQPLLQQLLQEILKDLLARTVSNFSHGEVQKLA